MVEWALFIKSVTQVNIFLHIENQIILMYDFDDFNICI